MKSGKRISTRVAAIGGVYLALSIVFLYLASLIPNIELTMFTLSSFLVAFVIIETSAAGGWLFYLASILMTFLIIPEKSGLIPFAVFFGIYPIVKYHIESLKKFSFATEIIMKLVVCNLLFGISVTALKQMFFSAVNVPDVAFPVLIIGAQIFFLIYDYLLTLAVGFYLKRRPKG